jgi:hypothetical protein
MACKQVYLNFFDETKRDFEFTVIVHSEILESDKFAREEVFSQLANLVTYGETITVVVDSTAPIGEVVDIYKMITTLTGCIPAVEVLPSGYIPAAPIVRLTF